MAINLNSPLSIAAVQGLLASVSDNADHQLRVDTSGSADIYLATSPASQNTLFQLEIWLKGNGYVGHAAASDSEWVERIYQCLSTNWPNPTSSYIDSF